ncbi:hypothetical protein BR93DRAFT_973546 [Coniochaeta sp. PMI_546]|nr:hypothetical protein BR93DRAFT_973546 [Coniochaeta sp. PMI_546]
MPTWSTKSALTTLRFTIQHVGKTAAKEVLANYKKAFPDLYFQLLSPFPLIAEADYVVARWFGGGKHTGQACFDLPFGSLPRPNSGRDMRFSGTTIFRLRDDKIVEETGEESALLAMQQLGLLKLN